MKKEELKKELMTLQPDGFSSVKCSKGAVLARRISPFYLKNNVCPCRGCVFAKAETFASNCPYSVSCFAHTRPDRLFVIFITSKN